VLLAIAVFAALKPQIAKAENEPTQSHDGLDPRDGSPET
jgi:hypothetical protein